MRRLLAALALAAALALGACGGGTMTKQELTKKAEGVTTKAELEKKLGKPSGFTKIGPLETWTYKASDGDVIFIITGDKVRVDLAGGSGEKPEKK